MRRWWLRLRGYKPIAAEQHNEVSDGKLGRPRTKVFLMNKRGTMRTYDIEGHWTHDEIVEGGHG